MEIDHLEDRWIKKRHYKGIFPNEIRYLWWHYVCNINTNNLRINMKKMNYFLFLSLLLNVGKAFPFTPDSEVGRIFYVEEKEDFKKLQLNLGYSKIIGNNLIDSNSILFGVTNRQSQFSKFGASFRLNMIEESSTAKKIATELKAQGVNSFINKPKASFYGNYSLTPFLGKLNVLNKSVLPFEIAFTGGLGATSYKNKSTWGDKLTPSAYGEVSLNSKVSQNYWLDFGVSRTRDGLFKDSHFDYTDFKILFGMDI